MSRKQKFPIGKFILFLCALALIIFITIPFLDKETGVSATNEKKKAIPQIFTANPLTSLMNSIYAMLEKTGLTPDRNPQAQTASTADRISVQDLLVYDSAQSRASLSKDGATYLPPDSAPSENSGSFNARFDYGDASFQNESGDWVLVRQTAPVAAPKGMHEVNTTDNAYERYVNQERAARHTPASSDRAKVPDSKLASIFRPLRNFIHGGEQTPTPAAQGFAPGSAASLVASSGIGAGNFNKMPSSYPKAGNMDFSPSAAAAALEAAYYSQVAGRELSSSDLFDPESNLLEAVDKWFEQDVTGKLSKEDEKTKNKITQDIRNFWRKTNQQMYQQMDVAAQQQQSESVKIEDTVLCKKAGSLYGNADDSSKCDVSGIGAGPKLSFQFQTMPGQAAPQPQQTDEQQRKEALAAGKAEKQRLLNMFPPSSTVKDLDLVVVLGKNQDAQTKIVETEDELEKKFYEFSLENKCKKEDCIWVATSSTRGSYDFQDSITASGLNFKADPSSVYPNLVMDFLEKETQGTEDYLKMSAELLSTKAFPYVPYTQKEFESFQQRPIRAARQTQQMPLMWVHSAKNAAEIKTSLKYPSFVIYDPKKEVFSNESDLSVVDRGKKINDLVIERYQKSRADNTVIERESIKAFLDAKAKQQQDAINNSTKEQIKKWEKGGVLSTSQK